MQHRQAISEAVDEVLARASDIALPGIDIVVEHSN